MEETAKYTKCPLRTRTQLAQELGIHVETLRLRIIKLNLDIPARELLNDEHYQMIKNAINPAYRG